MSVSYSVTVKFLPDYVVGGLAELVQTITQPEGVEADANQVMRMAGFVAGWEHDTIVRWPVYDQGNGSDAAETFQDMIAETPLHVGYWVLDLKAPEDGGMVGYAMVVENR